MSNLATLLNNKDFEDFAAEYDDVTDEQLGKLLRLAFQDASLMISVVAASSFLSGKRGKKDTRKVGKVVKSVERKKKEESEESSEEEKPRKGKLSRTPKRRQQSEESEESSESKGQEYPSEESGSSEESSEEPKPARGKKLVPISKTTPKKTAKVLYHTPTGKNGIVHIKDGSMKALKNHSYFLGVTDIKNVDGSEMEIKINDDNVPTTAKTGRIVSAFVVANSDVNAALKQLKKDGIVTTEI